MDIFGDDIDNIFGDDALNKDIGSDDEDNPKENEENEEGKSKTVDPKRRSVRHPQLRLNVERLIDNDRGVHNLEKYFENIKYQGKGHEKADLDNILKRIEHWAHRLYPKYNFKDFLAKTEQIGKKKQLQTHMYRYRQGLLELVNDKPVSEDENEEMEIEDRPFDEIDELLGQQIEKYKTAPSFSADDHDSTFDSMRSSVINTPKFAGRKPIEESTPMSQLSGITALDTTPVPEPPLTKLTSEQLALIAENRRKAQEKLKARREAAALDNSGASVPTINLAEDDIVIF